MYEVEFSDDEGQLSLHSEQLVLLHNRGEPLRSSGLAPLSFLATLRGTLLIALGFLRRMLLFFFRVGCHGVTR